MRIFAFCGQHINNFTTIFSGNGVSNKPKLLSPPQLAIMSLLVVGVSIEAKIQLGIAWAQIQPKPNIAIRLQRIIFFFW